MQKDITFGEKKIPMRATAATSYRYRRIFHADLLQELVNNKKNGDDAVNAEVAQKLGFIMAASAADKDMNALSEEDYIDWLDSFDFMELMDALPQVVGLYLASKETKATPKRRAGAQKGR